MTMEKIFWILLAVLAAVAIVSSYNKNEALGKVSIDETPKYVPVHFNVTCIDGVLYYYGYSGRLAPAFNRDSTVKLCEDDLDESDLP